MCLFVAVELFLHSRHSSLSCTSGTWNIKGTHMTCFLRQVNGAAMEALEESLELLENGVLSASSSCSDPSIELRHFEQALSKIKPSVSKQVQDSLNNYHSLCFFTLLYICTISICLTFFLLFIAAKETLRGLGTEILLKLTLCHHAGLDRMCMIARSGFHVFVIIC